MNKILVIVAVLFLSGCVSTKVEDKRPDPVTTINRHFLAYTCPQPPDVDRFTARRVTWDVISRKELDGILLKLLSDAGLEGEPLLFVNKETGDFIFQPEDNVIWALSTADYTNLGRNTSDILAALRQKNKIIAHYEQCILDSEEAVKRANERENASTTQ